MPAAAFAIDVPQITLDDLHERLKRTRWREAITNDWTSGASPAYLRQLGEYWQTTFDWAPRNAPSIAGRSSAPTSTAWGSISFTSVAKASARCR